LQEKAKKSAVQGLNMAVTLFGNRGSRSPLVEWYLHEIGTPYTHREDRAGLPNPFGQIPALIDDEVEIFESGAILLYLADKYGTLISERSLPCRLQSFQ
jgi:glutathione S-transferase